MTNLASIPMPPSDADSAAMVAVQRGDMAAYRIVFDRWREPIFRFLQRRAGSREAAEEAFQETWLRVYRWRHRYDPTRPFRPWLYRIAANAGHDARAPVTSDFHWIEPVASDAVAMLETLTSALSALPEKDRVLLLLVVEGLTSEEVAEILGVTSSAVRMALSRARQRILEAFDAPSRVP